MESTLRNFDNAKLVDGLVVIETLGFTPRDGFTRLGLHVDRAERTCAQLGFKFDRGVVLETLGANVDQWAARVRMTIARDGSVNVTTTELAPTPALWRVGFAAQTVQSNDPWLRVKTSNRAAYDNARAGLAPGVDEVVFCNERDEVCEGSITSLFVRRSDVLITPTLSCGVLPGVLRQELIETGAAVEGVLSRSDLVDAETFVGNSLRGLIAVEFVTS